MIRAVRMCREFRATNQKALKEYLLWRQELWATFNQTRSIISERVKCEADEAKYLRWKSALHALKN